MRRIYSTFTGLVFALCLSAGSLHAQALPTERRLGDLQVGGGFSGIKPDYGSGPFYGPSIFFDFALRYHLAVEGDVHLARYHVPMNSHFAENTYEIGLRYNISPARTGDKIVFYPKFLVGRGVFNNVFDTYPTETINAAYTLYSLGGGVEYKIKPHITIRVLDFEAQRWLHFPTGGDDPADDHGLTPYVATTGVAYHF